MRRYHISRGVLIFDRYPTRLGRFSFQHAGDCSVVLSSFFFVNLCCGQGLMLSPSPILCSTPTPLAADARRRLRGLSQKIGCRRVSPADAHDAPWRPAATAAAGWARRRRPSPPTAAPEARTAAAATAAAWPTAAAATATATATAAATASAAAADALPTAAGTDAHAGIYDVVSHAVRVGCCMKAFDMWKHAHI